MCGALRGLVPFGQFTKREKHPIRALLNFSYIGSSCFACDSVISKTADVSIILVW